MKRTLFLSAVGDRVRLSRQAGELSQRYSDQLPTTAQLKSLAEQYDLNTATLVLEQCLRHDVRHGDFIRQVEQSALTTSIIHKPPRLVIVPGLYYKEHPGLGGDANLICQIARQFGIDAEVVPTRSLGSIEENSDILHHYLQTRSSEPFWLASISRGGAEIKWLLYKHTTASYLKNLQGWVSVNGIVCGTRVFDKVRESILMRGLFRAMARLNRINPLLVDELHHSRNQWADTLLPENTQYINVISLPMDWDITAPVQSRYKQLSQYGPNDGAVVLGDYLSEPGLCFPVVGADHLMRQSNLSTIFYRLINHLLVNPSRTSEQRT